MVVTVKDPQDLDIFVENKKDEILEERGRWRDEDRYWVVSLSLSSFRVSLQQLLLCR